MPLRARDSLIVILTETVFCLKTVFGLAKRAFVCGPLGPRIQRVLTVGSASALTLAASRLCDVPAVLD